MRKTKKFLRVIRSYSNFEKALSVFLLLAFFILGVFYIYDRFVSPDHIGHVKEGIYTEGFHNEIYRINPVYVDLSPHDRDVSKLVFRGLTKYDPDTKKIVGDMANVNISEDRLKYTFTLKENIFWHDGEMFDASDIYFTYNDVIQSPDFQNPVIKANFDGVEINQLDEMTVEFVLSAPNSFFITNTTVGVLPEHILRDVPVSTMLKHDFNFNPIGTGSYKINTPLSNSNSGVSQVVLERNERFYGKMPQIQKVRFYGYSSKTDLIKNINSVNAVPKLTDEMIAPVLKSERFALKGYSLPQYNAVFINTENPLLKNSNIRLALQNAIYKDDFLQKLPNTMRVETPVLSLEQDEWRYEAGMDDAIELLENSGFNKFVDNGEDEDEIVEESFEENVENLVSVETDRHGDATLEGNEESDEIMIPSETALEEEAEEEVTVKYRKNADDQILEFKLIARLYPEDSYKYNETQTVIDYLKNNWGNAGVKLNIELYDATMLQQKIVDRDYDLLLFGQGLGYNLDLYGYWHSTQVSENGLNISNYKSFKVDTLIESVRNTFDEEEKQETLKEIAKAIQEDVPAIFLYRPKYYYATDGKVKGVELDDMAFPADRFCRINKWHF